MFPLFFFFASLTFYHIIFFTSSDIILVEVLRKRVVTGAWSCVSVYLLLFGHTHSNLCFGPHSLLDTHAVVSPLLSTAAFFLSFSSRLAVSAIKCLIICGTILLYFLSYMTLPRRMRTCLFHSLLRTNLSLTD